MKAIKILVSLCILSELFACSSNNKKAENVIKSPAAPKLIQPFRFHKAIEVKPGLTFDVLSWGRGAELAGGLLILRSDSTHAQYRSTTDELDGKITDAWNMDMDSDGNPEIFIQTRGEEKDSELQMYVFEFYDSGSSQKLHFPDLSSSTKKTYRGKDSIYVKEGNLMREFPVFDEKDTAGTKPEGKKLLEYQLRGNSFSVKEIKSDKG